MIILIIHQFKLDDTLEEYSKDFTRDFSEDYSKDKTLKQTLQDKYKTKEKVYSLCVFRRFIKTGTLYSSSLVYNTLTNTTNFFIKGAPEDILPYCDPNFLPKDIYRVINLYRKNGFINLILAGKTLDLKEDEQTISEDYYKEDLVFYGLMILKNKLKKEVKPVVKQLQNLNCDLIISTGDNIYNSLAVGYESGIITKKNIFHIDLNKISKKLIISTFNDLTRNDYNKSDKSTLRTNLDKISILKNKVANFKHISNKDINNILVNKLNTLLNKDNKDIKDKESSKNLENFGSNLKSPIFNQNKRGQKIITKNIQPLDLGFLKQNEEEKISNPKGKRRLDLNSNSQSLISINQNINSKNDLLDKSGKISLANQDKEKEKDVNTNLFTPENKDSFSNVTNTTGQVECSSRRKNKSRISAFLTNLDDKVKVSDKIVNKKAKLPANNSFKIGKAKNNKVPFNNYLGGMDFIPENMEKLNNEYIPAKLKNMRNECIYCVSGRALRYIYNNRHNPQYKKLELPILLNHIKRFGKIFYEMNSKDKSLLIDIYRKIPNKITCMVGDGQNDYDAMMTAHVGINLNKPVNMNTILCHFHPTDGSLYCIAKIIRYGRVIYENIYLLGISSFLCALNIVVILLILYYYDISFVEYELDFMSCNYFILSIIAFSVKPDVSIKSCLLFHNPSLLKCFLMMISFGNLIFNTAFMVLFIRFYSKNKSLEKKNENEIFGTYIYFMCYFQILGMIFSINSINFYRIAHRKNFFFWLIMILLIF